ncbi:single-stranded DNA-binding protein [Actinoplanes subtropicus]|uniref:single-stranded DNA-binding protein n=1 Tax=Actinoplanes subtropicus TaxID=543632 RepID=UPI0004C405E4|nr:single-stranded DNA-binding protein [Actinoplanes subtropicus]
MFETHLTIVGNVLTAPEWRRIPSTGALVANFRVASTARRYDREHDRWIDGSSLRLRVVAWRRLAENVASSVAVGDPVIVSGRVHTRDWKDENGNPRISYEMEAYAVGLDLARGRCRFYRSKSAQGMALREDFAAETVVAGLPSLPVSDEEVPIAFGEGLPDEGEPNFVEPEPIVASTEPEPIVASTEPEPEPKRDEDEELALEVERLVAEQPPAARRTRRTKREPVAA